MHVLYCYNMKTTIDDKLGDKVDASEKEKARPHTLNLLACAVAPAM